MVTGVRRWLLLPAILLAPPLRAQDRAEPPPDYTRGLAALERADTAAALAALRKTVRQRPAFGPAWLRLGALLGALAGEVEAEFATRLEAKRALETAVRLLPDDAEALLEYGLLLRKQQVRVDAERVLERAWKVAERRGVALPPAQRARLHYELGRIYEAWWEDWQDLFNIPPTAQGTWSCGRVSEPPATDEVAAVFGFYAVFCPRQWSEALDRLVPIGELKERDRGRMLEHLRRALEADPAHVDAAVRLLGHLADAREWAEYERAARGLAEAAPDEAHSHLFLGLGLHERGRDGEAEAAFRRALALLPAAERTVFGDVTSLLPRAARARYAEADSAGRAETARVLFAAKDPLFLTRANERELEHYARLAWAELKYGAPASGLRGWDTERGRIRVRYGAPWRRLQCCFGTASRQARGAQRFDFWSYGPDGPNFVFTRRLTYRKAILTEEAKALADELAALAPEAYRPAAVASVHALPHQLARFRGSAPDLTRIEVYAATPVDSLRVQPGDTLETGLFLFDGAYRPVWDGRRTAVAGETGLELTYLFEVPAGEFRYGIEAREAGPDSVPRPAARVRAPLSAPGFPPGRLSVSDLLVAHEVTPRTPAPARRQDLSIVASRTLRFRPGEPVHLYFEVYGLDTDADGLARYRAELAVEDSTRRNVVDRLLRGAAELFRRQGGQARVQWERTVEPVNGIAVDYLAVELAELEPGEYAVRIGITDPATGARAEALRRIRIATDPP